MEADLVCGICHDESLIELGEIDCCEHRFCYQCIAKWSEIESKCPFCKLRFKTLTRLRLDSPVEGDSCAKGRLAGTVVSKVEVPEKDQRVVFEDPQFLEWLEGLSCIICNGSEQEDQLLLCDGCDQACHTFCLGLSTVPEDAWFCSQCQAARATPVVEVDDISESPYSGNARRLRRRISRTRPYSIIESDEECVSIEDSDGNPSPEEIMETIERPSSSGRMKRHNIDFDALRRRVSSRGNVPGDSRTRLQEDYQRVEIIKRNWESLRGGRLRFEDIIDSEEYVDLVSPGNERRGGSPSAKLKSPGKEGPEESLPPLAKDKFSPPLLDLRSRLRMQLLSHERERVGIPHDDSRVMTTPTSSMTTGQRSRALPSSWRNGRVTTLGDLSFGASVAAGRITPKSRGHDSTPGTSAERLFAHKTQAMVHAAVSGSSGKKKEVRNEGFEKGISIDPDFDSSRMNTPHVAGPSSMKSLSNKRKSISPSKMARDLVAEQISTTFRSVSLPKKMENFIRNHAVKGLLEFHPSNMNATNASAMVDQALEAYNKLP